MAIFNGTRTASDSENLRDARIIARASNVAVERGPLLSQLRGGAATAGGQPAGATETQNDGFWKPGMVPGILPIQPK